jgi:hypothetical protein
MRKSGEKASVPAHFLAGSGCDGLRFDLQKWNRARLYEAVPFFRRNLALDE